MSIPATAIWEVELGASDTLNGGGFDPGNANFSNGFSITSATGASPVVSHSSYNFVAGDVGAWFFLKSGTNSIPGWYKIASVASNQATLNATAGQAVLYPTMAVSTATGCGTSASLSTQVGSVDYSQQSAAAVSLTGLTTAGVSATVASASATLMHIGNMVKITAGTNFTTGIYNISNVSAGVSFTLDRNATTGVGALGTAGLGGAFASPGIGASQVVSGNFLYIRGGASPATNPYSMTGTANTAGGPMSFGSGANGSGSRKTQIKGYGTVRGDQLTQPLSGRTRPVLKAAANSLTLLDANLATNLDIYDLEFDGTSGTYTGVIGCYVASYGDAYRCYAHDTGSWPFFGISNTTLWGCWAANNGHGIGVLGVCYFCYSDQSTSGSSGFESPTGGRTHYVGCIVRNNSTNGAYYAAGHDTYIVGGSAGNVTNTDTTGAGYTTFYANLAMYAGSGGGNTYYPDSHILNCAMSSFGTGIAELANNQTLTGVPFVSFTTGNWVLNSTTGQGALCLSNGFPSTYPGQPSTTTLTNIGAIPSGTAITSVNVTQWLGTAVTAATAGIPDVNAKNINNVSTLSVTTINANQGTTQPLNFTGTGASALVKSDVMQWLGTAVTAATAGIPDVNAKNINNVSTLSVTTINANQGTTQPLNFTGTGASALVKSDVTQWLGTAVTAATAGIPDVNAKNINNVSTSSVTTINANQGTTQPLNFTGTGASALVKSDVMQWLGTAVTAATAGIPDVNAKNINNVSTLSVTTINANQGTTQPLNFTGTGASALVKSDMVDVAGSAVSTASAQIGVNLVNISGSAVSTTTAQLGVNAVKYNNQVTTTDINNLPTVNTKYLNSTLCTGRDIGTSVLLSNGTGTGQIKISSGYVSPNWGDVGTPSANVNLSGTKVGLLSTLVAKLQRLRGR